MEYTNKEVLQRANEAIMRSDNEGFLAFCSESIEWDFVGGETLQGKEAVRAYMKENYIQPPQFTVEELLADGDFVVAIGKIEVTDETGKATPHSYCDVWHLTSGKLDRLAAFVIKI